MFFAVNVIFYVLRSDRFGIFLVLFRLLFGIWNGFLCVLRLSCFYDHDVICDADLFVFFFLAWGFVFSAFCFYRG